MGQVLRPGAGKNDGKFWRSGGTAIPPRTARLAGRRIGEQWLGLAAHPKIDCQPARLIARHLALLDDQREIDPKNELLSRGPRLRLRAELIRDNALAISGLLNNEIGGPSAMPYQPEGLWEELAGGADEDYVQDKDDKLYRRSLYVYRKRTVPHPLLSTFDAPSWEVCQVKRETTNTPLQSLALLNDTTYVEAARKLAERMLAEGGEERSRPTRPCISPFDRPASESRRVRCAPKCFGGVSSDLPSGHLRCERFPVPRRIAIGDDG